MGIEFRIVVALPSESMAEQILAHAGGGVGTRGPRGFDFRSPGNSGPMPDAMASVEPYGFYFCSFSGFTGLSAEVFGAIVGSAAAYGRVVVEDLE
ncbi:hypothetical protein P3W85_03635 [Cupriavidus basilensis]|uniref:Uncharacterized protein n=1 Tax=Cupriavidus basilensis TaxID=68895 RepID=A0ABT6AI24_9BURK|nr:hypothetical protein [Cupriavidus basilensis]MDF3832048.1 hypothetical protein [Cupriavidus basilensis]